MNLMDWLGQHPEFSQRFDQFMANHPNFNPQPRMQFRGMTGGNTPAMQFPMAQTGGGLPAMQMPNVGTGGVGQRMPMHPMTGGPAPTDGGYDGSGINPGGMYTGGNTPQRFPMNRLNPRRGGLAGMFAQYA